MTNVKLNLMNVYGPADAWDGVPEGTTVGTSNTFVGFAVGFGQEHLLLPEEVDKLIALLRVAAQMVRERKDPNAFRR